MRWMRMRWGLWLLLFAMVPQKQKLLTNSMLQPMARHALLYSLKLRNHTVKQQSQKLLQQFPAQNCKAASRVHVHFLLMLIGSCQDPVILGYHLMFIFSCYSYSLQQNSVQYYFIQSLRSPSKNS